MLAKPRFKLGSLKAVTARANAIRSRCDGSITIGASATGFGGGTAFSVVGMG